VAKTIHMMIRVFDEARSVAFYRTAFELTVVEKVEFETFALIYMANAESGFELELTVNRDRAEPYDLGDGYGHLAVSVDDLDAEHRRLLDAGLSPRPISEMGHGGAPFARFFFITDPDGYKIEVLQRRGRFQ